jgi:hypothetical protein
MSLALSDGVCQPTKIEVDCPNSYHLARLINTARA